MTRLVFKRTETAVDRVRETGKFSSYRLYVNGEWVGSAEPLYGPFTYNIRGYYWLVSANGIPPKCTWLTPVTTLTDARVQLKNYVKAALRRTKR